MRKIDLENIGPIERLTIPLPEAGVVVLHGRNGAGKSHALAAVEALAGGRGRPACRDGAARGKVEGFGARMTIGRSTRRTGEAEVLTLEGRLDVSQLVSPPVKDEEAADRVRIKALLQLAGAPADPVRFAQLLPSGRIEEIVAISDCDDAVSLAGKIKRGLEAEARKHERAAEAATAKAAALADQAGDISPEDLGLDRETTERELQRALVAQSEIATRAAEAEQRRAEAEKARKALDALGQSSNVVPAAEIKAEISELEEKIGRLEKALAVTRERRGQLREQFRQAQAAAEKIEKLEKLIRAEPELVPRETLDGADDAVLLARRQHARAAEVDRARRLIEESQTHEHKAEAARARAAKYRDSARAVDDVLTEMVGGVTDRLRIEEGRLVLTTDRGTESFAELSPGERWRIALEIAAEQVGASGLVTVPQEGWEGLDPQHRAEIAEIARQVGVVILTAEATESPEVMAETYGGK